MRDACILIIEDELKTAEQISKGLEENGFAAEIANDGMEGKNMFISGKFNLIILDLNLPIINGFNLCFFFRNSKPDIPIIMLTAMGAMDDKLAGFDAGADDYLVKPFEFPELLARVRALLKRSLGPLDTNPIIIIADLQINLLEKTVYRSNLRICLTPKEFTLLEFLARNNGKVMTRSEIAEKVWDINFDTGTNVIDVFVTLLRKKIDKNFSPRLIHTVYGTGFVLRIQNENENENKA
jgi:two-component system, OmpR family, copper resistance phosphate regulon response regulator CusR